MKRLLVFFLILGVLFLGVKLGVDYYLSNRFSSDVEAYLSDSLGTKVSIDNISTNIISSVSVNNVSINEPGTDDVFASVKKAKANYDLTDLLKKRLSISNIDIFDTFVNIVRYRNNNFNFDKFKNLVMDFSIFPDNRIYAEEVDNKKKNGFKVDVNRVKSQNMVLVYNDRKVNQSVKTGKINASATIDPLDFDVSGTLFNSEKVNINGKRDGEAIKVDLSVQGLDITKYQAFYQEYIKDYDISIQPSVIDAKGTITVGKKLEYDVDAIIKKLIINYSGVDFVIADQNINVKDQLITLKDFDVDINIKNEKVSSVKLNGTFKDFNQLKATFDAKLFEADFMRLFDVLRQEMKTKGGTVKGSVEMDIKNDLLKLDASGNVPYLEYAFITGDKKKICFPGSDVKISTDMKNMKFDVIASGDIFKGSFNVDGYLDVKKDLLMFAQFEASKLSGLEFLKLNDMDKIPVQGEVEGNFELTGKNFDIKTFKGRGDLKLTKAVYKTMGLDKLLEKSGNDKLKELTMKDITTKVFLEDERFRFSKIEGDGNEFNVKGGGSVGFDMGMDFSVDFKPVLEYLESSSLGKYLTKDDVINIRFIGTVFEPDIKTNVDDLFKAKVNDKLQDKLEEKAKDWLDKLF